MISISFSRFLPFEIVDSKEFKAFVAIIVKMVNMKHSTTYSRQMEQYSAEILEQVKATITKFCTASAALTTDLWTSRSLDAYISLTVHYVDEMLRLHK